MEIHTVIVLRTLLRTVLKISTEIFKDFVKSERVKESTLIIKDQINLFIKVAYFN